MYKITLSRKLGMTIKELDERMGWGEIMEQLAYDQILAEGGEK